MNKRLAVIGIIIENTDSIKDVNTIISAYEEFIVGRMGIPYKDKGVRVISLIMDGSTDDISSITGKIGNLVGVSVKAAISKK
ncbi:MAG: TM1266 family iron-only hydrogenase system putative regulator [Sarcina sp.]